MTEAGRSLDLTEGDLLRPVLLLSAPIVASQLLQTAYNLADTFWVGRLGQDAVSALSFSFPLVFFLIGLGGGFTGAGTVLVSQHRGAGNEAQVARVSGETISFVFLFSVVLGVGGFLATPVLLDAIGTTPGTPVHRMAVTYTQTIMLGVYAMFGFLIFEALLRGYGDTRTPMYLMAVGVVLNVVVDPFLILGFQDNVLLAVLGLGGLETALYEATGFAGLGIQGAAIATVLSRGVVTVVGLGLLFAGRVEIQVRPADLRLRLERVKRILDVGAPLSVAESLGPLTLVLLTAIVALAGEQVVAGYGIGNRVLSVLFLIPIAVSRGTETVVGQNLGAGLVARARRGVRVTAVLAAGILALASVVLVVFAEPIVGVFIAGVDRTVVISAGAGYIRIFGLTLVFFAVFRVLIGAFRGAGSTRTAMLLSLLALWFCRLPPPFLLYAVLDWGVDGLWYGMAVGNVVGTLVTLGWYLRGSWTSAIVADDDAAATTD